MRMKNKLAVVTAGASGMGRAGCELFAREGAKVAVVDINEKGVAEVVAAIKAAGGEAHAGIADLSKHEEGRRAVNAAADKLGGIDVLWSHAGIPGSSDVEDIKIEDFELSMNLNVTSAFFSAGAAATHMRKRGKGSIIF